jgi:diguanylate cyclase (GGDEF)-like protein
LATTRREAETWSIMSTAAALIYWVIVAVWLTVLATIVVFYVRNPRTFGTTRLLLAVIGIDTIRNIVENVYFGLYFGGQYGLFSSEISKLLGNPYLLIVPKLINVAAGCLVLGLLLHRWLPSAIRERGKSERDADDLKTLANTDGLTGLYNRRHFDATGASEWAHFQRYRRSFSVLLMDVDCFKIINDRFGHDLGDNVLKIIASVCTSVRRGSDTAARIGGDEFGLLLPETSGEAAFALAERLRTQVRACTPMIEGQSVDLSVSLGIAEADPETDIHALLKRADAALYEAKRSGRNRAVIAKGMTAAALAEAV